MLDKAVLLHCLLKEVRRMGKEEKAIGGNDAQWRQQHLGEAYGVEVT